MKLPHLYTAWKKLILTFLVAYAVSLSTGLVLVNLLEIAPETIFEMSTKRLAYALPVMDMATKAGIDGGILLFIWNTTGALATLSFIYTAALFNPLNNHRFPKSLRKIFCNRSRMKLLCFLPGCTKIKDESLRRLFVWLMTPYIGMILLGVEVGFSASTSKHLFGSYLAGFISLLPHGIIEIPAFALAGAVTFSGHLLIKPHAQNNHIEDTFLLVERHRRQLPIIKIVSAVVTGLFIAGLIEAHVTGALLERI